MTNAGYRQIHPEIWDDPFILDLEPDEKLLFIYMFSNARSSLCGLYEISIKQIVFQTGLEEKRIIDTIKKFEDAGKIISENNIYFVVNQFKRHFSRSPKVITRVNTDIESICDCKPKTICIQKYEELYKGKYPIHIVSGKVEMGIDTESYKDKDKIRDNENKIRGNEDNKEPSSSPTFISDFITAVRVKFTNDKQPQMIDDLVEDYGEKVVLDAANWYGSKTPSNMGHALKSIESALRNGWNIKNKNGNQDGILAMFEEEIEKAVTNGK